MKLFSLFTVSELCDKLVILIHDITITLLNARSKIT